MDLVVRYNDFISRIVKDLVDTITFTDLDVKLADCTGVSWIFPMRLAEIDAQGLGRMGCWTG